MVKRFVKGIDYQEQGNKNDEKKKNHIRIEHWC
jgi:hypothetical protein